MTDDDPPNPTPTFDKTISVSSAVDTVVLIVGGGCSPCGVNFATSLNPTSGTVGDLTMMATPSGGNLTFTCTSGGVSWSLTGFMGITDFNLKVSFARKSDPRLDTTDTSTLANPSVLTILNIVEADNNATVVCTDKTHSNMVTATVVVVFSPSYEISSGNDLGLFSIDMGSGMLTVAKSLVVGEYTLTISYFGDTSMPKTTTTKTIKVVP